MSVGPIVAGVSTSETAPSPIRQIRLDRDEHLVDVAKRAEISVGYLSMIERGGPASVDVLQRLARAYELEDNSFLPGGPG
jgi:transcriptional regulator with XRE-family HTH domain